MVRTLIVSLLILLVSCAAPIKPSNVYKAEEYTQFVKPEECKDLVIEFREQYKDFNFEAPNAFYAVTGFLRTKAPYKSDEYEFWRTPAQTLRNGGGDCEDISILTASFLIALGYKHRITIVCGKVPHAGLHIWLSVVYPGVDDVVLDNYNVYILSDRSNFFDRSYLYRGSIRAAVVIK